MNKRPKGTHSCIGVPHFGIEHMSIMIRPNNTNLVDESSHGKTKTSRDEYLKIKLDFRVRKMTKAASKAEDADTSRTPGLNPSVQTSMNDHGVRYYLCRKESASVFPFLY